MQPGSFFLASIPSARASSKVLPSVLLLCTLHSKPSKSGASKVKKCFVCNTCLTDLLLPRGAVQLFLNRILLHSCVLGSLRLLHGWVLCGFFLWCCFCLWNLSDSCFDLALGHASALRFPFTWVEAFPLPLPLQQPYPLDTLELCFCELLSKFLRLLLWCQPNLSHHVLYTRKTENGACEASLAHAHWRWALGFLQVGNFRIRDFLRRKPFVSQSIQ